MNVRITERKVIQSALWAAYGDALGFITELADHGRVEHRSGTAVVETTIPWRRKINSRSSVFIEFPAGVYSDDTQLRLSVSRCIRADGTFDVASFAKVELTSWLNYALGAGISSREAAANLARTSATWYSNFFSNKRIRYIDSGGNGAAMRVQPHVWASKSLAEKRTLYRDVIRNTISSHGHPRAIVGACFHAATLAFAFETGRPASLTELAYIFQELRKIDQVVEADNDLRLFWIGQWTEGFNDTFTNAINRTVDELESDVEILRGISATHPDEAYHQALIALDAFDAASRGSGTKTALLANYVAAISLDWPPEVMFKLIANALGSDTDSIGTMAGAIIGAYCEAEMLHPLQDREYIEDEARRLYQVSQGNAERSFSYPDLRSWKPERAAVDAVIRTEDGLILNGIARARLIPSPPYVETDGTVLQWLQLKFGQTILAKVRENPISISDVSAYVLKERTAQPVDRNQNRTSQRMPDLFSAQPTPIRNNVRDVKDQMEGDSLNALFERVLDSGFDPSLIGRLILQQARDNRKDFVERGVALTATILTAYNARVRRR